MRMPGLKKAESTLTVPSTTDIVVRQRASQLVILDLSPRVHIELDSLFVAGGGAEGDEEPYS